MSKGAVAFCYIFCGLGLFWFAGGILKESVSMSVFGGMLILLVPLMYLVWLLKEMLEQTTQEASDTVAYQHEMIKLTCQGIMQSGGYQKETLRQIKQEALDGESYRKELLDHRKQEALDNSVYQKKMLDLMDREARANKALRKSSAMHAELYLIGKALSGLPYNVGDTNVKLAAVGAAETAIERAAAVRKILEQEKAKDTESEE